MTMAMPCPLVLVQVDRCNTEVITPAKPTPREFKILSPLDDQKGYQSHISTVHFYRNAVGMEGRDPVKVIKKAISQALIYYYPFAGRLRKGVAKDSLILECTGEGIMFIEASAQGRLDQYGDVLHPPFQGVEDLLYVAPGCNGILHSPLLLIQVTRFICGGFTFALTLNHTMSDATGIVQFMTAVAELARGAPVPSIEPVWKRELLTARDPLQVSCLHHAYDNWDETNEMHLPSLLHRSFFFTLQDIDLLRSNINMACSRFELVSACLWKCRTIAMKLKSDEEVRLGFFVDARAKVKPPMPVGYYGNVVGVGVASSTVGELSEKPLNYAVDLVKKAKAGVNDEFMRSTIDVLVKNGRPYLTDVRTYYVTCLTQMNFEGLDFGWGKPIYGGPTATNVPGSSLLPMKNSKGEDGILVTMNLPRVVIEKFAFEMEKLLSREKDHHYRKREFEYRLHSRL